MNAQARPDHQGVTAASDGIISREKPTATKTPPMA
jgi:hypothetical protein